MPTASLGATARAMLRWNRGKLLGDFVMAAGADTWYVRLPDGRTLRARNAEVLRGYLSAGRIPWESRVRRSGDEEWRPLDDVAEFAVALPGEHDGPSTTAAPAPSAPRSSSGEIRTF